MMQMAESQAYKMIFKLQNKHSVLDKQYLHGVYQFTLYSLLANKMQTYLICKYTKEYFLLIMRSLSQLNYQIQFPFCQFVSVMFIIGGSVVIIRFPLSLSETIQDLINHHIGETKGCMEMGDKNLSRFCPFT